MLDIDALEASQRAALPGERGFRHELGGGLYGLPLPKESIRPAGGVCLAWRPTCASKTVPDPAKTGVDNQAFHLNQLLVGGMQASLGIVLDEDAAFARLRQIREEHEGPQ